MKNKYPIEVSPSGTVILGERISCDGFHRDFKFRVQTHVHMDHMHDFETSKGLQTLFMSEPTLKLLIAEFNAELPYRDNIIVPALGVPFIADDTQVNLLRSGHMLGAVQVAVQTADGDRLGYSGDFQWPVDEVIKVDALVVDSTYGSPDRKREYSQDEAETRFLDLVLRQLRRGPVYVNAHRGTLQRALQVLSGHLDCPFVGSPRLCSEAAVYRDFGYAIAPIIQVKSPEGRAIIKEGKFIRLFGTGDQQPVEIGEATSIQLSAFMSRPDDPVMEGLVHVNRESWRAGGHN